jgi:NitT/TauT family transport system substrate-binding protein
MWIRSIVRLAAFTAALMFSSTQALAQNQEKVVLLLNWYLYSEHAPFFLGKEKGYFAKEGIDLDIQEGRGSGKTVEAIAANTATFGYADVPTMIKAAAKGAQVKAVGIALQRSPMSVMGFADKNIKRPSDIKGKTVAVTHGDAMMQVWPRFLEKTGLKETDYKVVAGDGKAKLNAVINGEADLLLGYVMDQAIKLQDATNKPVYAIRFSDFGVNMVSSGVIASKETIANKPDLVKRFMRAATKSLEESAKNPAAAVDAMLKAKPDAGKRDTLIIGMKRTAELYHTPDTEKMAPFNVSFRTMFHTMALLNAYGGVGQSLGKAQEYYTNEFLP